MMIFRSIKHINSKKSKERFSVSKTEKAFFCSIFLKKSFYFDQITDSQPSEPEKYKLNSFLNFFNFFCATGTEMLFVIYII